MRIAPLLARAAAVLLLGLALTGCEKVPPKAASPATAPTAPAKPLAPGVDYVELPNGAPFEPEAGRIEVVEVFGYSCPHCAHFEPMLEAWRAKQPADVKFVAVPAPFGGWWMPYAKAYYAAKDLGLADRTHAAMFDAIHVQRTLPGAPAIATDAQIAQFYAKFGADPADFARRMESASVAQQLRRADEFINRSGVDGTPTLVVDGRYRVEGGSLEDALRIAETLIARQRAMR